MSKGIEGYKVFNRNWKCLDKQYSCPGEFEENVKLSMCERGMHFCTNLTDCLSFYMLNPLNHFAKVEAYGQTIYNSNSLKGCTDKLKIIEEISFKEVLHIISKEFDSFCDIYPRRLNLATTLRYMELITRMYRNVPNIITFSNLIDTNFLNEDIDLNFDPRFDMVTFYFGVSNGRRQLGRYYILRQYISSLLNELEKNNLDCLIQNYTKELKENINIYKSNIISYKSTLKNYGK